MKKTEIPLELARRISLDAQLLDGRTAVPEGAPGKENVARTIETLGYVQIDTIAVVERAHHHTLWTRCRDYDLQMLHELQAKDRRVFEYWGHAASYLPMSDYRYHIPRMRSYHNPKGKWHRKRLEQCRHLLGPVLERIREEGPLSSEDFASPPGAKRGTWWDWKPSKVALEMLFWRGDLMITERRNFHKVYDLTERVLPESVDTTVPDDAELGQFLVCRALSAYGVAREKEIHDHIHAASREVISKALGDLLDAGEVIRLEIEELGEVDYYTLPETIDKCGALNQTPPQVSLLSPFDNLVIQRDRTKQFFGFDYTLECYTPAAKRKYGYFTLPILWGERLVGRLDPKADRKRGSLMVRNLVFEPEFGDFDELLPAFARHLREFARFNQCQEIQVQKALPTDIKPTLERLVEKAYQGED